MPPPPAGSAIGLEPLLEHVEALKVIGGDPLLLVDDEGIDATVRHSELVLQHHILARLNDASRAAVEKARRQARDRKQRDAAA